MVVSHFVNLVIPSKTLRSTYCKTFSMLTFSIRYETNGCHIHFEMCGFAFSDNLPSLNDTEVAWLLVDLVPM